MLRRGDGTDEGLEEIQVEEVVYVWKNVSHTLFVRQTMIYSDKVLNVLFSFSLS